VSASPPEQEPPFVRAWHQRQPGQLIGKGHPAGDFLEAYRWTVLEERPGVLRVRAILPAHVMNPRGQLFGGFTPTYVDLVALLTVRTEDSDERGRFRTWLATTNMRVDYFEPVTSPEFIIESRLVKRRKRTILVETRFYDPEDTLAVFALTTMREIDVARRLGDA
jgi:acyl-coenzyme A thioesterase PaaI-like protein